MYTFREKLQDEVRRVIVNKNRDWRFELLRIIAMFLIVASHFYSADNWSVHTSLSLVKSWASAAHDSLAMLGQIGVSFFVLISAYFLAFNTKSPFLRVLKLWLQIFIYSVGSLLVYCMLCSTSFMPTDLKGGVSFRAIISSLLPITYNAYWFMSAFCVLTLLTPFIVILFNQLTEKQAVILITIMIWTTFIWKLANPSNQYFTDVTYLTTIFMIGVFIRRYQTRIPQIRSWQCLLILAIGFFVCIVGTYFIKSNPNISEYGYNSNILTAGSGASPIISVTIATIIFIHIAQGKTKHITEPIANFILHVSPATFGVYLIHENFLIKPILWHYIFLIPESHGLLKAIASLTIITVTYATLLIISWIILNAIITPLTKTVIRQ